MNHIHFHFKQLIKLFLVLLLGGFISACGGGGSDTESSAVSEAVPAPLPEPEVVTEPLPGAEVVTVPPTQPELESEDYNPDPLRLDEEAETSHDLFVDADFTFDTYQEVVFDINVTGVNNSPLSGLILAISLIDGDIVEYDDPRLQQKSLLSMAKTDANGQIYISLELPQMASKVLLELNAVGIQNDVIKSIVDGRVLHHFSQQQ